MNRPLGTAVIGAALAVLATAPPAQAAWQVGAQATSGSLSTARLEARIDTRDATGLPAAEGTSTYTRTVGVGLPGTTSTQLVDVVNTSSVTAQVGSTLTTQSTLSIASTAESCSVPWTVDVRTQAVTCSGPGGATIHMVGGLSGGSATATWTSPPLAPSARRYLRLRVETSIASTTTLNVRPKGLPSDRSAG